jgi:hypothetical protein
MVVRVLQVFVALQISLALAMALADALELPGKMRLKREAYVAMQPVYYPGFTIGGGIGEAGGTILTIVLLLIMPRGTAAFWLTFAALLGLIGMQAVYWLVTHPVNGFWLRGENLSDFSASFFATGTGHSRPQDRVHSPDWTALRDRWEYSHVIRAGFAFLSMVAIVVALQVK